MDNINNLFKDKALIDKLVRQIATYGGRQIKLMEVCGTHTMSISKYGIRSVLPDTIKLISGPGCPVCVTPGYFIKSAVSLSRMKDVIITTFGDLVRIPSQDTSLLKEKARGADIRIVYSPLDSLEIARENPSKKVVFLSVGFETTTPVVALTVLNAVSQGITNFMILSANKTIPEAMRTLSSDKEIGVDGYIYPGHVSAVTGDGLYHELADKYGIPGVITGFEPVDILGAVLKLTELINNKESRVLNLYGRVVSSEGNPIAVQKTYQVFEECDAIWRGLGLIPMSGLRLRKEYESLDAWKLLGGNQEGMEEEPAGCRCGDILKGICIPCDCKLFKTACTPETPVGSCMVSSEGTCAAYYRYG